MPPETRDPLFRRLACDECDGTGTIPPVDIVDEDYQCSYCEGTGLDVRLARNEIDRLREALERIAGWTGEITRGEGLGYEGPRDVAKAALAND